MIKGPANLTEGEVAQLEERLSGALAGGVWSVGLDLVGLLSSVVGASILTVALFFLFLKDGPALWG